MNTTRNYGKWRYVYDNDSIRSSSLRNRYVSLHTKLRQAKKDQLAAENEIEDDSLGDEEKQNKTLNAGDKINDAMRKLGQNRSKLL